MNTALETAHVQDAAISIRNAELSDGKQVWALVRDSGTLELNTAYAYLLLCTHFQDSTLVAEKKGKLVGCVLGYRLPRKPDTVFVWQVSVAPDARGQGLANRLLTSLMQKLSGAGVRYLEASVAPDNAASMALFMGFARKLKCDCQQQDFFPVDAFPVPHPAEPLLRIGPVSTTNLLR